MPILARGSAQAAAIDAALATWRQGDVALDEHWFVHVGNPGRPLTEAAAEATEEGFQAVTSEAPGLVVVTQTCDIVRNCVERPYVEVSPLVQLDGTHLAEVRAKLRPKLATFGALAEKRLAVDLDRVMTVEKSIVESWNRTPGCSAGDETRDFAEALARKRQRFAFPEDFTSVIKKLRDRLSEKHDKQTDEGRALRALREIRVHALPSWEAPEIALWFWFVRKNEQPTFEGKDWPDLLAAWLNLVRRAGRYTEVLGLVSTLDELSGSDLVGSDRLDLDHLSSATG